VLIVQKLQYVLWREGKLSIHILILIVISVSYDISCIKDIFKPIGILHHFTSFYADYMIYIAAWYYAIISIYQKLLAHIPIKLDHLDADASCPSGHFCGLTLLSKQQQKCYAARDSGAKCYDPELLLLGKVPMFCQVLPPSIVL